mmetsp:Transcript_30652/g.81329  ORF Transcript_30652/g.81329 Transcript_30652/m.81329 type:complete len:343 (-) Transcript_30652:82-1110(-)
MAGNQEGGAEASSLDLSGDVVVQLRLPDGSTEMGHFWEGAAIAGLASLAMSTEWAKKSRPAGVDLSLGFPRRTVEPGDTITKEFHHSVVNVTASSRASSLSGWLGGAAAATAALSATPLPTQEESNTGPTAPQNSEATVAAVAEPEAQGQGPAAVSSPGPDAETEAEGGPRRRGGVPLPDELAHQGALTNYATTALAGASSRPTAVTTRPQRQVTSEQIEALVACTGATREAAREALQASSSPDAAAAKLLEAQSAASSVLRELRAPGSRAGMAPGAPRGQALPQPRAAVGSQPQVLPWTTMRSDLGPRSAEAEDNVVSFLRGSVFGALAACAVGVCASMLG